eukprot:138224_1
MAAVRPFASGLSISTIQTNTNIANGNSEEMMPQIDTKINHVTFKEEEEPIINDGDEIEHPIATFNSMYTEEERRKQSRSEHAPNIQIYKKKKKPRSQVQSFVEL